MSDQRPVRQKLLAFVVIPILAGCAPVPERIAREEDLAAAIAALDISADAEVLVGAGDIASCSEPEGAAATGILIAEVLARAPEALVFTTGDHAYPDGTPEEFEACYEPAWGAFNARTIPTPGNHDYRTPEAAGYYGYFEVFQRRPEAVGRGYFTLQLGEWRILVMNSLLPLEPDSPQIDWVKQLAAEPADCVLAIWHHPLRSSAFHGWQPWDRGRDTDVFWKALAPLGVDVILNGHDHVYERFAPLDVRGRPSADGARQFTVGTGGAELHPVIGKRRHSEYLINETYGVLLLLLRSGSYEWAFIGTDGVVHDRSTGATEC